MLLKLNRNPTDVGLAFATARALTQMHQFELAAELWGRLAALPGSFEPPILFATCLAMLGRKDEARAVGRQLAPMLAALPPSERAKLSALSDMVYPLAGVLARGDNQDAAEAILDLLLPYEPYGRRLLNLDPPGAPSNERPARLDDETIAAFIRGRIDEVADGRIVPPGRGLHPRRYYEERVKPLRSKRILIVHRDRYWPTHRAPNSFANYLAESAAEVGLEPRLLRSDFVVGIGGPADAAERQRILDAITQWQPHVVIYENLGAREEMFPSLAALRRKHDFKLIGLHHDVWVEAIATQVRRAAQLADAMWIFDPLAMTSGLEGLDNVVSSAPPVPEGLFAAARAAAAASPRYELGFIGSIAKSNYLRTVWLVEAKRRKLPLTAIASFPQVDECYATPEGFAGFLARCKASLCITGRTTTRDAIPLRVWEGVLAGSVLIEDGGTKIRHFLVPFAHYVPVTTIDELAYFVGFLDRRDDVRKNLVDSGLNFLSTYYSSARSWYEILAKALDQHDPAASSEHESLAHAG